MKKAAGPRVLAIVLNWQQADVTLLCVQALRAMNGPALDILVIDNGSKDDSAQKIKHAPGISKFLQLSKNLGFAAGNNAGLRLAGEEGYAYALIVNNDAFAQKDMLVHLLAETHPDIAMLSPKIFYESDRNQIWFANGRRQPATLDLRDTGRDQQDGPQWMVSRDVDYLLGTCLLVDLAAARKVGLLDERFFFYFEDLDWSIRFQQAGYRLRLVADAHLYHQVAISTGGEEDSPLRRYHLASSSVIFWRKHAAQGKPLVIFLFRLFSAVKMVLRLMVLGRFQSASAYLKGLRDGWRRSQNTY